MKLLDRLLSRKNAAPHTFHGGLSVPGHKALSTAQPSRELPLAETYYLSLRQRNGLLQTPIVAVGERVLRGQTLTLENGAGSVPRHAPTSGTITAILEHDDIHASGQRAPNIVITPDGLDQSAPPLPALDWANTAPDTLRQRIHDCGISGMGGAGFPSARKLSHQTRTLVVNAAECEPYITCDDMQIRECAAEIISGAQIAAHITGAETIHFGIEDDKPHAIAALERAIAAAEDPRIRLTAVPTRYPSGNSRQLFELLLGIRVPTDRHAAEYGLICHNSATIKAIHDAIRLGLPLTERYITLTGEALARPQVVRARFGAPLDWLIRQAGGAQENARTIIGGPMMGHPQNALAAGIKKTTNCVLLLPATPAPQEDNCIRCARCSDACPMELLPQQLYWYSRNSHSERLKQYRLFDCIECGICASVCPSAIPLVDYYRHSKAAIRAETRKQQAADHAKARHDAREARLAREAAEREAKMAAKRAALQQRSAQPPTEAKSAEPVEAPQQNTPAPENTARRVGFSPPDNHEKSTGEPLPLRDSSELAQRERGWGEGKHAEGLSETTTEPATPEPENTPNRRVGVNPPTGAANSTEAPVGRPFMADTTEPATPPRAEPVEAQRQPPPVSTGSTGLDTAPQPFNPAQSAPAPPDKSDAIAAAKARAAARKAARLATQNIEAAESEKPLPLRGRGWGEGSKNNNATMPDTPEPENTPDRRVGVNPPTGEAKSNTAEPAPPPRAEPVEAQRQNPPVSTGSTGLDTAPTEPFNPTQSAPDKSDAIAAAKARAAARKAARMAQNKDKPHE